MAICSKGYHMAVSVLIFTPRFQRDLGGCRLQGKSKFSIRSCISLPFHIVRHGRFSFALTTPRLQTWTSLRGCSSQALCASVAAPSKLCTWRCWLRYSFVFFCLRYVRRRAPGITDARHSTWLAGCHRERPGYARRNSYWPL